MSFPSGFLFMLIVHLSTSGTLAIDTCSNSPLHTFIQRISVPQLILPFITHSEYWFAMVTKDDAIGVDSELLKFGGLNKDFTLNSNFTTNYSNGSSVTIPIVTREKLTNFLETQPDATYETYVFPCGLRVLADYRCRTVGANGRPNINVYVSTKYSRKELTLDLLICRALLDFIVPGAEFTELSKP